MISWSQNGIKIGLLYSGIMTSEFLPGSVHSGGYPGIFPRPVDMLSLKIPLFPKYFAQFKILHETVILVCDRQLKTENFTLSKSLIYHTKLSLIQCRHFPLPSINKQSKIVQSKILFKIVILFCCRHVQTENFTFSKNFLLIQDLTGNCCLAHCG